MSLGQDRPGTTSEEGSAEEEDTEVTARRKVDTEVTARRKAFLHSSPAKMPRREGVQETRVGVQETRVGVREKMVEVQLNSVENFQTRQCPP